MAKKGKATVVVTEAARQVYAADRLIPRLMAGEGYFACSSVAQNGSFLDMELSISPGSRELRFTLSIPLSDVLYIVKAADMKQLGFKDAAPSGEQGVE